MSSYRVTEHSLIQFVTRHGQSNRLKKFGDLDFSEYSSSWVGRSLHYLGKFLSAARSDRTAIYHYGGAVKPTHCY